MGNEASVVNETGQPLTMHIFNHTELLYKVHNGEYQLPATSGLAVPIRGTAGGGAVKAGILYQNKKDESYVYDIFSVKDGGKLYLKAVSDVDGIIDFAGDAVLVEKGKVVKPLTAESVLTVTTAIVGAVVKGAVNAKHD